MKILDIEFEFDLMDADMAKKFEYEMEKVKNQSLKKEQENMPYSQAIREECNIIEEFFDNLIGEGTSQKIFKGKKNLLEHIKAFQCIADEKIQKQRELQDISNKYMPRQYFKKNYKGKIK